MISMNNKLQGVLLGLSNTTELYFYGLVSKQWERHELVRYSSSNRHNWVVLGSMRSIWSYFETTLGWQ